MYPPPAYLLNRVLKTTQLKTRAGMVLFAMDQDELDALLEDQAAKLKMAGHTPFVVSAYRALAPLLLEREAIGEFLSRPENSNLRGILPEVTEPAEAVELAAMELMFMTPQEKTTLLQMFGELM